jgi:hypothetical protein
MERTRHLGILTNASNNISAYFLFCLIMSLTTIGGKYSEKVGLPSGRSLYLAEDILTALIANRMGISLSYAKKRYVSPFTESRWLGLTDRIDQLFSYGREQLRWYVSFGLDEQKEADSYQDLSMQFFFRNVVAFDAAKRLSELGYLCEVAVILRMAVEQFAFAGRLWSLPPELDLRNIRPVQCLNYLKNFVPASGRLYGLLSKYTHFEYDHHTHFFAKSSTEIFTIQRDSVLRAYATHLLFLTMVCISRYVLNLAKLQFTEAPGALKKLDGFVAMVQAYSNEICGIIKQDLVLEKLDLLLRELVAPVSQVHDK